VMKFLRESLAKADVVRHAQAIKRHHFAGENLNPSRRVDGKTWCPPPLRFGTIGHDSR
jgi:hypothetical protein